MELKAVEEIALANVGVFAICASMDALCLRGPSRLHVPARMLCDSSALVTWSCRHRRHRRGDTGGSGIGNGSGILQSSESGFSGLFRNIMTARHKITVPRSVSGSACFFQNMHFRHNRTRQRSRKHCKTQHFCNKANFAKNRF